MIRRLRKRHRRASVALAFLVPLGLAVSLLGRAEVGAEGPTPPDFEGETFGFGDYQMQGKLQAKEGVVTVQLWAESSLVLPDLLLYWSSEDVGEELSGSEILLGSFQPRSRGVFHLPAQALADDGPKGTLVLFSLAHGEVAGAADLGGFEGSHVEGESWD